MRENFFEIISPFHYTNLIESWKLKKIWKMPEVNMTRLWGVISVIIGNLVVYSGDLLYILVQ